MTPIPFTYLALGDSYTIGEGIPSDQGFPWQLRRIMNGSGYRVEDPVVIAKTGWTTSELIEGINQATLQPPFDLVTLLIGVNNQYRGLSLEEYQAEFKALLEMAIQFAGTNRSGVYVLSIPDWSATPFAADLDREQISSAIDRFNEVNRNISDQQQVSYIDITEGSRNALADPALVAGDDLHPSATEYHRWAMELASVIEKRISIVVG